MTKTIAKKKSKMTLELDIETLAELKAAVIIFGAKSYSSLVHQQVVQKIREAKQMVSKEEFDRLCAEQLEEVAERSKIKAEERKKSLRNVKKTTLEGEEVIEDFDAEKHQPKSSLKKSGGKITTADGKIHRYIEEDEGFDPEK